MKKFNTGDKVFANGWRNDTDDHDHECGTNSTIEKWVRDKTELTIMEGPNRRNVCKVTDGYSRYWLHTSEIDYMAERITLQKGDYVSTKGVTESQYYKAVEAFEDAGGFRGTPIDYGSREYLLFDDADGEIWGVITVHDYGGAKRHLTIDQVLSTANAGGTTQDPLTTTLEQASEHDATAKHHAAMHERLMQQAREMLPEGWRLVHDTEPGTDMADPANWREGDFVECIKDDWFTCECFKPGQRYEVRRGGKRRKIYLCRR